MLRRMRTATLVAVTICLLPMPAHAQFVTINTFNTFNTLAEFLNAVSGSASATDNFNDLSIEVFSTSPLLRRVGLYRYRANAANDFFGAGTSDDASLSTDSPFEVIVLDQFSPTVRGVGGLFSGTALSGAFLTGSTITLNAVSAGGSFQKVLSNMTMATFFGFVSTSGAITSLTITVTQPNGVDVFATVDNLVLAALPTPITTVPEPSTYAMLGVGLATLATIARRRRA